MSPIDIAVGALLLVSFVFALLVLAILTLLIEALLFALGLGRRDYESRP